MNIEFLNFPLFPASGKSFQIRGLTYSHNLVYLKSNQEYMQVVFVTPGITQRDMIGTMGTFHRTFDSSGLKILRRVSLALKNYVASVSPLDSCIDFDIDLEEEDVTFQYGVFNGYSAFRASLTDEEEINDIAKWRASTGSGSITSAFTVMQFRYHKHNDLNYQAPLLEDLSI